MAEQVVALNITDVPPPNFKNLSQDAKDKFLKEHGLPSKPTLSLYDCYHQAAKMTHVFKAIGLFVKYISGKVVPGNAAKLAKRMIDIFNTGIWELAQSIRADCKYLMENGKYSEESTPMEPADFRKIDTTTSDKDLWDSITEVLQVFLDTCQGLNKINPVLKVSYADILRDFIDAGKSFMGLKDDNDSKDVVKPNPGISKIAMFHFNSGSTDLEKAPFFPLDPVHEPPVIHYPGCGCKDADGDTMTDS